MKSLIRSFTKFLKLTAIGLAILVGVFAIVNPFTLLIPICWIQDIPKDVSLDPKYAEIYQQTFTAKQDLFLCQWEDSKRVVLKENDFEGWCKVIEKVDAGTKLYVKKIVEKHKSFVGTSIRIFVEIDDPKFAAYRATSRKAIDAEELILNNLRLAYQEEKAQFDPELLEKYSPNHASVDSNDRMR